MFLLQSRKKDYFYLNFQFKMTKMTKCKIFYKTIATTTKKLRFMD